MFKRLKTWLRSIIAEEVAKLDASLQREKDALLSHFAMFDEAVKAHFQTFDEAVMRHSEVARLTEENTSLKETIKTLTHYRATPEQIAADHALRKSK